MATPTELSTVVIEFSIGLGGFSGIVAAFVHRTSAWAPVDRYRLLNLLSMALGPAFLAFIALGMMALRIDAAWRVVAAAFAIYLAALGAYSILGRRHLPAGEGALINPFVWIGMMAVAVTTLVLQLGIVVGAFGETAFAVFYFGLVALLAMGVTQFVRIITARPGAA